MNPKVLAVPSDKPCFYKNLEEGWKVSIYWINIHSTKGGKTEATTYACIRDDESDNGSLINTGTKLGRSICSTPAQLSYPNANHFCAF